MSLTIAPKSGFAFTWHGCLGLYDQNHGNVIENDGQIKLTFAFENKEEGFAGCPGELTPIHWGERIYLIPSKGLIAFCNDINSRREPRTGIHGSFFLRDNDWDKKVDGMKPELPEKYQPYLLEHPVDAKITEIVEIRQSPDNKNVMIATVRIDKGKKDGLLPGMKLHVTKPDSVYDEVILKNVDETQSEGIFWYNKEEASPGFFGFGKKDPSPKTGWSVSTCPSWSRNDRF